MEKILISEFKAKCIESLKKVNQSGHPLVVTLRGKPLVTIHAYAENEKKVILGGLTDGAQIPDGIEYESSVSDWESLS
ncbi:MAG: type II toxin-antitoxin system prevent-host-death family antitoxin [Verrucomicrobiota bacterium]|nr:type II toxin-antitoxin system prevent-host-death family antitoxin [Verrucomicrobiota bacterium]